MVEVRFGAANHYPTQFHCPVDVRLERENRTLNLPIGAGVHMCVGNQLARGELRLALLSLVRRSKNFRYARETESVVPFRGYSPHGSKELWISFDWR